MSKKYIETRRSAGGDSIYIKDTRVRVSDIAELHRMLEAETPAERIQRALPSLSLDEIRAALDYWLAHPEEIEREIEEEKAILETIPTVP